MLEKLSERFTDFLSVKGIIQEENREIYIYGFIALLSTIINIAIVLTIGITAGIFLETIIFFLMFGVLRVYCGGYHAETHISCILIFIGIYGFAMAVAKFLPVDYYVVFSLFAGTVSLLTVFLMAPIEHKNKPFIEDEYVKFKKMSRIIAALQFLLIIVFNILFPDAAKVAVLVSLAMLGVNFILILARVVDKRR
ncbi:MAG: accessory gene regulator ArgB-like protein [Acetivibrionales bacterium]